MPASMVGEVVNNYEIKSLLGEGGMGSVYLAEHPFMGRKAAIKVLRPELAQDRALVERFMNEARAANAIRHPNIIDIIDVGRTPSGVPYLMMEFLEGQSLAKRIADARRLPLDEALDVASQTAAALTAAHSKGIVHRDLKPDNLFLIPDESRPRGERVKVLDFGIAKLRGDLSNASQKTQAGALMGTPPYMSPEQCRGLTDEIDERTDVYALGIILFEMLCGTPPFVSEGWGEIVLAHLSKEPPRPRDRNPAIPADVEATILKALAKTREQRFSTMAEMRAAMGARATAPSAVPTIPPRLSTGPSAVLLSQPRPGHRTTTFRAAAGEVTPVTVLPVRRRRRALALVMTAAVAVGGVLFATGTFRPGRGTGPGATAPSGAPAPPTPVMTAVAPIPPPPTEVPPAAAPPATPAAAAATLPAQITVRLTSDPDGATVTDASSGLVLGSTPFERRMERGERALDVRVTKTGFATAEVTVPLVSDFERAVRLGRGRSKSQPAHREASTVRKPPAAVAAAPAPVAATPAIAPSPPPPPPKRVEKW